MRASLVVLLLTFASQAAAECGNLCDDEWWKTATTANVQAELSGGADVMARNKYGGTPLHVAAASPANIQALLDAGAVPEDNSAYINLLLSVQTLPRDDKTAILKMLRPVE